jgi:peptide/nickel transport system substrate-binding protein
MSSVANWWDKDGDPQYGGEIAIRASRDIVNFDPYFGEFTGLYGAWMERLIVPDWTKDPSVKDTNVGGDRFKGMKGNLAESWEFPDARTHIVHLRKGIHWQDIPPANGREFVAEDVVFHYNRFYGLGGGFAKASPHRSTDVRMQDIASVTAADKYTVVFKFKTLNPNLIMESLHNISQAQCLENPDAVKKWGDVRDWHHAIGTGPFILRDFVQGKSVTLVKNPNYWAHDERHPQNKLPYVDAIKYLIIPDDAEAAQAMLAGKLDIIHQIPPKQAQAILKKNPDILYIKNAGDPATTIQMRNDKAPFTDIRVRKAMQMALDLPGIAKNYYGGTVEPYPSTLTNREMKGWGFPYEEWPQALKDEYAYNPTLAKKLLAEAGFPKGFKTHIIASTDGDLELLEIAKTYLADIGVEMEIRNTEPADWTRLVETEQKHEQLIYRRYGPLGHNKPPLRVVTQFQTGYAANYSHVSDPVFDSFYPRATSAANDDELKLVLRDANEHVARQHYAVSLLLPIHYALYQPWVKAYNAEGHSVWMGSGGPSMLSFYGARYWIDTKLKEKMAKSQKPNLK